MLNKIVAMVFIMALTAFMCANVLEAQVIEDGLVLYWPFDEADIKGDTVSDVVGGNDGTLIGGPAIGEGKYGDGLVFGDGASRTRGDRRGPVHGKRHDRRGVHPHGAALRGRGDRRGLLRRGAQAIGAGTGAGQIVLAQRRG